MFRRTMLCSAICVASQSAHASRPTCHLTPFVINGADFVSVNAINDLGVAIGVSGSKSTGYFGFRGKLGRVARLPEPSQNSLPVPTGINNAGTIVGYTFSTSNLTGFVLAGMKYSSEFSLGLLGNTAYEPYIGSSGLISFNVYLGAGQYQAFVGPIGGAEVLSAGSFASVASVNGRSQAAGQFYPFINGESSAAVFLADAGSVTTIIPPGFKSSYGGYLNDAGVVAGSALAADGKLGGFVFSEGSYKSFQMPSPAASLSVYGIGSNGLVAGSYSDSKLVRGFVYDGDVVSTFGGWPLGEQVHVYVSPRGGNIALSAAGRGGVGTVSYLVSCSPPGR